MVEWNGLINTMKTDVISLIKEYHKLKVENEQLIALLENLLEQELAGSNYWRNSYMALVSSGLMVGSEQGGQSPDTC